MTSVSTGRRAPRGPRQSAILQQVFQGSSAALGDEVPVAICVCDVDGQVVRFNSRAAELWAGIADPGANLRNGSAYRFYGFDGKPIADDDLPVMKVLATAEPARNDHLILERSDRTRVTLLCNVNPVLDADGSVAGAIVCLQDLTPTLANSRHALVAALQEKEDQRLVATYEHAGIGIAEVDSEGRFLRVNEALTAITGYSRAELMTRHIFDPKYSEDAARDRLNFRQQVSGGYDRYSLEKRIKRADGTPIWLLTTCTAVRDAAGNFLYGVRVVHDITEQKRAEERNKALLAEFDHRLKNTLATVQTLAQHTLRDAGVSDAVRDAFESRLVALGHTHDVIGRERWESANLDVLVNEVLQPFRSASTRLRVEGRPIKLRPRAAVRIGLVLHELADNAAKYGAMSVAGGSVDLSWEITPARALRIEWRETGGPEVRPPEKRGFGSRLLEWNIIEDLKGGANVRFEPSGFSCRIEIPLVSIAA